MVVGARPIDETEHFSKIKKILQHFGSWAVRKASNTDIPDAPSGFRAMTREAAMRINVINDYTYTLEGAEKAVMEVVELPVLAHLHFDVWRLKLIANIGCYAGYRLSIQRFPGKSGNVSESVANSFLDTDRRFDYGIKGGAGIGLIFDPLEIHITAMYKHSFSSLYQPDYYSQYYYRYAYPSNIIISAGVHFQLTKRTGKTKTQLKKAAKEIVYGNNESKGR